MVTIDDQQKLFLEIGKTLKKPISAYAIGGTAMMFLGLKNSTKDIDLVFENEKDRNYFIKSVNELGFEPYHASRIYKVERNQPIVLSSQIGRVDLFLQQIIDFYFSDDMKLRAKAVHQFHENFIIKIADYHDIILLKCATDRQKDKDDAMAIIENKQIDWDIIIKESENQVALGEKRASFELGCFLEDMKNQLKVNIPEKVLDKLFEMVKKQVEKRKNSKS